MNLAAIITYLIFAYLITVHVGCKFYSNGKVYIMHLMQNDEDFSNSINKLLLTGYYLLNLGYSALMITGWEQVNNLGDLVRTVGVMLGRIIITLGIIHFMNMAVIYQLSKNHTSLIKK